MSPRARTAADIIIVYSRRPWESRRHCASPPLAVASSSWVKVVYSVSLVRGMRVLDGVSSPRPDSVDSATLCARTLLGATPIAQPVFTLPLRTTGPAAARTSAIDARTRGQCASVSRHHNLLHNFIRTTKFPLQLVRNALKPQILGTQQHRIPNYKMDVPVFPVIVGLLCHYGLLHLHTCSTPNLLCPLQELRHCLYIC